MNAEFQIQIFNADETEIAFDIVNALVAGGVQGDNRDEIGMYLRDGKSNSVFVNPTDVTKAVAIINGLGFETDEDSNED